MYVTLAGSDGGLQPFFTLPAGSDARDIASADMNGDGFVDLLTNTDGAVRIYLSNGDGTFRPPLTFSSAGKVISITPRDMNGDGKMDLVTTLADKAFAVMTQNACVR